MKKTGNDWEQRHDFKQMPGMYSFVELSTVNKDQINQQMAGKGPTAPCVRQHPARLLQTPAAAGAHV